MKFVKQLALTFIGIERSIHEKKNTEGIRVIKDSSYIKVINLKDKGYESRNYQSEV